MAFCTEIGPARNILNLAWRHRKVFRLHEWRNCRDSLDECHARDNKRDCRNGVRDLMSEQACLTFSKLICWRCNKSVSFARPRSLFLAKYSSFCVVCFPSQLKNRLGSFLQQPSFWTLQAFFQAVKLIILTLFWGSK